MNVKDWPIGKLHDYAKNPRINDHAVDRTATAIKQFGFRVPVLAQADGEVIDGHLRLKAARALGMKKVPVVVVDDMTPEQIKAFRISVNKVADLADWDMGLLKDEMAALDALDFDLSTIGFDAGELADIFAPEGTTGLTDEDAVPEAPEVPVTVEGDVWLLGRHRLMCGDSTCSDAVGKLMGGEKADFCFTSPPYGQQRDYTKSIEDWDAMMIGVYSILPVNDGAQVLVNLGLIHSNKEWQPYWNKWVEFMRSSGWLRFALYVWDQGAGMMGDHKGRLAPSFELIFHFCKENRRAKKTAKSKLSGTIASSKGQRGKDGTIKKRTGAGKPIQDTKVRDGVIRVNRQLSIAKAGGHPAPFPVELCRELSTPWVNREDICYEPFTGSGTQIINCEQEGFLFRGMELAPSYVDISVNRWQNFTGGTATLEATGQTFAEVSQERTKTNG